MNGQNHTHKQLFCSEILPQDQFYEPNAVPPRARYACYVWRKLIKRRPEQRNSRQDVFGLVQACKDDHYTLHWLLLKSSSERHNLNTPYYNYCTRNSGTWSVSLRTILNYSVLCYYAAWCGFKPTFRDYLSVPFSKVNRDVQGDRRIQFNRGESLGYLHTMFTMLAKTHSYVITWHDGEKP